ncbi:MAG TPA: aconitate hydratase [Candidatus Manganitrophaceae bacterium]|nr:aconitate hydratase [Candidatus Manganitrophaceae bacterium]
MGKNLTQKILEPRLKAGRLTPGEEIGIKVDQVITQDATGTVAYLQFEALGLPKIQVPLAVAYVDHNTLQTTFRNADDHLFLQTAAAKYGAYFSRPGNGIIHQVHLERFAKPGGVLVGSDSHCCNAGAMAMFALGTGGLDITQAMATGLFYLRAPEVHRIRLEGEISRPWVTSMDVMLELLRRVTVKGGVGKVFEFDGPGVAGLSLTERATISNMGIETGATAAIFPSDDRTRFYLAAEGREKEWIDLKADPDAEYAGEIRVGLSQLEPLIAKPHNPDNVVPISECAGIKVDQVCVGSCTNSSLPIMRQIAALLDGRTVAPTVSMLLTPGSKQVLENLIDSGDLGKIIKAGARVLEPVCGPCVGMGGEPGSDTVTVRSFNRNFKGRSGNPTAKMYLCNPIAATAIALRGEIVDPRTLGLDVPIVEEPDRYIVDDNMILPPAEHPEAASIYHPASIPPIPVKAPLEKSFTAKILLKLGDNVSTDEIMPAGSEVLPYRSDIPMISRFLFRNIDPDFAKRAEAAKRSFIIAGSNYGQGSSREHAALAPMYLGMRGVICKSIARIHRSNLINYGLLPLIFVDETDYEKIDPGDRLKFSRLKEAIRPGESRLTVQNVTKNSPFSVKLILSEREHEVLFDGGLLPYLKGKIRGDGEGVRLEGVQIAHSPAEECH